MNPASPQSPHARAYGVGLAYRFHVHREMVRHRAEIDLLEVSTEDYLVRERKSYSDPDERLLRDALERFPCVAHGLSLSIGTVEPPAQRYLESTKRLLERSGMEIFSEHLAFHRADGNDLTLFLAIPFDEAAVQWVAANYRHVRAALGRPFALENVTYGFAAPGSEMDEPRFLTRLCEETDCTLLLDVTNLYNNAHNHGYDAYAFLDAIPMERISQMHLAGGVQLPDGRWEDSHSAPVMPPVWDLYEEAVRRATGLRAVILERDSKLTPFEGVMGDIRRAREIFYRHRPADLPADLAAELEEAVSSPAVGREPSPPDPLDPEYASVRAYQRALMARIADPAFRDAYREDAPAALRRFGIQSESGQRRLDECPAGIVSEYAEAWNYFREEDAQIAREYQEREWAAWARQLG